MTPYDGAAVSGFVTIAAIASDDTAVTLVQFYANGVLLGTSGDAPYQIKWNTRKLAGAFVLTAIAWDAAGNSACSDPVMVTISTGAVSPGRPPKNK
jgi:hypothetical protein